MTDRPDEYEQYLEDRYGTAKDDAGLDEHDTRDDGDGWAVEQQGLGDRTATGQARLDGGISKEVSGDE